MPPGYHTVATVYYEQSLGRMWYVGTTQRRSNELGVASAAARAFAYRLVNTIISTQYTVFEPYIVYLSGRTPND